MNFRNRTNILLSLFITLLVLVSGIAALTNRGLYHREAFYWQVQVVWQDLFDLLIICPLLIITSWMSRKQGRFLEPVWLGTLLYLVYTYCIYCFDVHFNRLFLFYCAILGLSFYTLALNILRPLSDLVVIRISFRSAKLTATFLILVALIFYVLWLFPLVPALIENKTPADLLNYDLPTNPVHVLDLAVLLPAFVITGVLLLKRNSRGYLLSLIILTFSLLMSMTIAGLQALLMYRRLESNVFVLVFMGIVCLLNIFLLFYVGRQGRAEKLILGPH